MHNVVWKLARLLWKEVEQPEAASSYSVRQMKVGFALNLKGKCLLWHALCHFVLKKAHDLVRFRTNSSAAHQPIEAPTGVDPFTGERVKYMVNWHDPLDLSFN